MAILTHLQRCDWLPELIVTLPNMNRVETTFFHQFAECHTLTFYEGEELDGLTGHIAALDLVLVCRFNLLKPEIFNLPRLGCVNVHSSLLPQYPGVHPVSWALVNGEARTGVTIHRIDGGIDTGGIFLQKEIAIDDAHNLHSLTAELNLLSAELVVDLFSHINDHRVLPTPLLQNGRGWYARRRNEGDSRINWQQQRARTIFNLVRSLPAPYPHAFCYNSLGDKIEVVHCRILDKQCIKERIAGRVLFILEDHCYLVQGVDYDMMITTKQTLTVGELLS
jgi:methionyl-tRNA formyltransferase